MFRGRETVTGGIALGLAVFPQFAAAARPRMGEPLALRGAAERRERSRQRPALHEAPHGA